MLTYQLSKVGRFEPTDQPVHRMRPDEVIVRLSFTGICGSDIQRHAAYVGNRNKGMAVLGHECCGIVSHAADKASELIGKNVVVLPFGGCRRCRHCQSGQQQHCRNLWALGKTNLGAFAEAVVCPAGNAFVVPDDLPMNIACLADPVACAVHALKIASLTKPARVAVLGAGALGLSIAILAKNIGCDVHVLSRKTAVINKLGLNCLDQYDSKLRASFRIVFEAVGGQQTGTFESALELAEARGRIVVLGVYPESFFPSLRVRALFEREVVISGSHSFDGPKDFVRAIDLLRAFQLTFYQLITHTFPSSRINDAFATAKNSRGQNVVKVMLQWP